MTKRELIEALEPFPEDEVVVCMDGGGGWDNIEDVNRFESTIRIVFGGGSPFSSDK